MKVALVSVLSLVCLQVTVGASLPADDRNKTHDTKLCSHDSEDQFALSYEERVHQRLGLFQCLSALRDVGSVAWKGWGLLKERQAILQRAKEGRENCTNTSANPEDLEKCMKTVEEKLKADEEVLNQKIWELMPKLLNALVELFKCLV